MEFDSTSIEDLYIARSMRLSDERGSFMRLHCEDSLKEKLGINFNTKQINFSHTVKKGSVRGMHYQQAPALEGKIVRCIQGRILDVAVDLRKNSKTFLQNFAIELSESNDLALIIPKGFAHGFQVLEDNSKMIYLHNESYTPKHERGIRYDDPRLNINWSLKPINLSERDLGFELIDENFKGI